MPFSVVFIYSNKQLKKIRVGNLSISIYPLYNLYILYVTKW